MPNPFNLDLSAWNNEGNNARLDEFWELMKAAPPSSAPMTELIDAQLERDTEDEPAEATSPLGAFDAWQPDHQMRARRHAELLEAHADADFAAMQAEFQRDAERLAAGFDAAHSVVERVVARVQS
jgi:hypothetical protein